MTLRIKLFGSLELERDGRPLARFASRKSGELFAYLALNRKAPHTREHLAGVFWGDSSEERARHTLNTTLWRINRVLEPPQCAVSERGYLRVSPQRIGFNAASGVWLDVAEFETRCELAEHTEAPTQFALYAQAVNLYRADLLADCYEDWCIVERERLQGLYVRALAQLMSFHSSNAEHDLAIDCARRILTCDPLREEVHRDLMRLHLQAGQPAAALRQYRQCEDMLRDELGVDPAPETRALLTPILGASSETQLVEGMRTRSVTANDLSVVAAKIHHLAAACDAAQTQLQEAMALLRELTTELQSVSTEPQAARSEPQAARSEPQAARSEPQAARSEPQAARSEPQAARSEPQAARSEPQAARNEPPSAPRDPQAVPRPIPLHALTRRANAYPANARPASADPASATLPSPRALDPRTASGTLSVPRAIDARAASGDPRSPRAVEPRAAGGDFQGAQPLEPSESPSLRAAQRSREAAW